jgi:hypothetical protein
LILFIDIGWATIEQKIGQIQSHLFKVSAGHSLIFDPERGSARWHYDRPIRLEEEEDGKKYNSKRQNSRKKQKYVSLSYKLLGIHFKNGSIHYLTHKCLLDGGSLTFSILLNRFVGRDQYKKRIT